MLTKPEKSQGKLRSHDQLTSRFLTWAPTVMTALAVLPLPALFLFFFLTSASTDSAAFYLLLSLISLGVGLVLSVIIIVAFWLYRRRWSRHLRERLAADGITVSELSWFHSELSSEEKKTWRELETVNPLLADAYAETLAARLTATRVAERARGEVLHIDRQINRTRHLRDADTVSLIEDLTADRERAAIIRKEAKTGEVQAKARLHSIEAVARRELNQTETSVMLQRLSISQSQMPLSLEMAKREQKARTEIGNTHSPSQRS